MTMAFIHVPVIII